MQQLSSLFVDGAVPAWRLVLGSVCSVSYAVFAFLTLRWLFDYLFGDLQSWYPGALLVAFLGFLIAFTPNIIRSFFGLRRVPLRFRSRRFERERAKAAREE